MGCGTLIEAVELIGAEWSVPEASAWCGAGTRSSSMEAIVLGCDEGLCAALVRVWTLLPPGAKGVGGPLPIELIVRSRGHEIRLLAGRRIRGPYLETHPILLVGEGPIRVEVAGEAGKALSMPTCLAGATPGPVILPLGDDLQDLSGDWRVEEGLGGAMEVLQRVTPGGRVLLLRCRLDPGARPDGVHVRLAVAGGGEEAEAWLRALGGGTEAAVVLAPREEWTVVVPELVIAFGPT